MRSTIDKAGRLVIPKPLRDQLGLRPGDVELTADGAALRVIDCPSVARHEGQSMLDGRCADKSAVHRSAGDAERSQPGKQLGCRVIAKKTRRGKVVCQETGGLPPDSFALAVATG